MSGYRTVDGEAGEEGVLGERMRGEEARSAASPQSTDHQSGKNKISIIKIKSRGIRASARKRRAQEKTIVVLGVMVGCHGAD